MFTDLALAMIDAAYDKESDCRDQICDALFDLGKRRPGLVLSSCYSYLKKHNKVCKHLSVFIISSSHNCMFTAQYDALEKK